MTRPFTAKLAAVAMVLAPVGAALVAQPAAAQHSPYRVAQAEYGGQITRMSLYSNAGLRPGATLRLHVFATPGAEWANATLGDIRMRLVEQRPGEYVGTHLIRPGEHIDTSELVRIRAGWGDRPAVAEFTYPPSFQALAPPARTLVETVSMSPRDGFDAGDVVRFRVEGMAGADVRAQIPGVVWDLPLREIRPGVYVGRYTIRRGDDLDAFEDARVVMRSGSDRVVVRIEEPRARYGYGYGR